MKDKIFILFILLTLALSLSACNNNSEMEEPSIVQEPTIGGEISIGIDEYIIDPLKFLYGKSAINDIDFILYRGLLKYNEALELNSDLAETYLIDKDNNQIKIILKSDIKWQDGTNITLDDVMYTYELYSDSNYYGDWKQYSFNITGTDSYRKGKEEHISGIIISEEEKSIVIQYEELTASDLDFLTAPILSKNQLNEKTINEIKTISMSGELLANGCYAIESISNEKVILERNEQYEEDVYLDRITISTDMASDYDIKLELPQTLVKEEDNENIEENEETKNIKEVITITGEGYQYLGMNLNSPIFKDIEVRKALSTVINYEDIIKNIYLGYGTIVKSPFHPESWLYINNVLNNDQEAAKKILIDKNLSLEIAYEDTPFFTGLANELSRQLSLLGISIELNPITQDKYISTLFSKGEFDLFLASWAFEINPISENKKWLAKDDVLLGGYNVSHVNDKTSDQLLIDGEKSLNIDERKTIYQDWQEHFMNQYYIIPIASPQILYLHEPTVHVNIINSLTPYYDIQNWWIEK